MAKKEVKKLLSLRNRKCGKMQCLFFFSPEPVRGAGERGLPLRGGDGSDADADPAGLRGQMKDAGKRAKAEDEAAGGRGGRVGEDELPLTGP